MCTKLAHKQLEPTYEACVERCDIRCWKHLSNPWIKSMILSRSVTLVVQVITGLHCTEVYNGNESNTFIECLQ